MLVKLYIDNSLLTATRKYTSIYVVFSLRVKTVSEYSCAIFVNSPNNHIHRHCLLDQEQVFLISYLRNLIKTTTFSSLSTERHPQQGISRPHSCGFDPPLSTEFLRPLQYERSTQYGDILYFDYLLVFMIWQHLRLRTPRMKK